MSDESDEIEDVEEFLPVSAGTRVTIEVGTSVYLEIEGIATPIKSVLIGMQPGEYLIVKSPPSAVLSHDLRDFKGRMVVVRYLAHGTVFGFQTSLLSSIIDPVRLMFLICPRIIQEYNLRAAQRLDCHLPCHVMLRGDEIEGVIQDTSLTGCRVSIRAAKLNKQAESSIVRDTAVQLRFHLPGEASPLTLAGKIRNIEHDSAHVTFGMAFDELAADAKNQLSAYLAASE